MDAGTRWRELQAAPGGTASEKFAWRIQAAEELERIEAAYASGDMEPADRLSLWAAMQAAKLPPLTQTEIGAVAHVAAEINARVTA